MFRNFFFLYRITLIRYKKKKKIEEVINNEFKQNFDKIMFAKTVISNYFENFFIFLLNNRFNHFDLHSP